MDLQVLGMCLFIIVARVGDVSLGTIRTIFVVNGRRGIACMLAFFEVLLWVVVVARVITNLNNPLYMISYAIGFALGNYVGMTVERWFAFGEQVVRIFTRDKSRLAEQLREAGYRVTEFEGRGRDGLVHLLFVQTPRRDASRVARTARELDPSCYYVVDDVRLSSTMLVRGQPGTGLRGILQRK